MPRTTYIAPRWLPGGHAQTIYAARFAPRPSIEYRRERWNTPDGDFIDVDWLLEEHEPRITSHGSSLLTPHSSRPLVVLFHGLEGSSRSHYALALMHALRERGIGGVVVHFRGCSGELNRLPRAYHSGDSAEVDWVLRRLAASGRTLYAAGISLGGNALLKWLGEHGTEASSLVLRAAAVSAPVDLMAAGAVLDRGFNLRLYTRHFLMTMRRKALDKLVLHPGLFDARAVMATRTLRAFDDIVTAPLHGFRDTDDYWTRASSKRLLRHIAVPTLLINARNDPFMPRNALPFPNDVSSSVTLEYPAAGGHVGFVTGSFPGSLDWLPERLIAHFWP